MLGCPIHFHLQGGRVALTDKAFVVPLMNANATLNAPDHVATGMLWAEPIEWGQVSAGQEVHQAGM
jgi:hypothetical protein